MLLGTLGASVLGKTLTSKVANRTVDTRKKCSFSDQILDGKPLFCAV